MADLSSGAAQEVRNLTERIDAALGRDEESEQTVWTFKVGDIVTTTEFCNQIKFRVAAYTEVVGIPGYSLEPVDSNQKNPKTGYAFGKNFRYPCPENSMRVVQ